MKGLIFLVLFGSFFAGFALFALFGIIEQGHSGEGKPLIVGIIICSVFLVIGFGIIALAFYGYRKNKTKQTLKLKHPNEPWLLEKKWSEGRVKDGNKTSLIFFVIFALFWNGISWITTIAAYRDGVFSEKLGVAAIISIFPLIGLFLIRLAIHQFLKYKKYGTSIFELAEVPGFIGGTLGGVIFTKVNVVPEDGFKLALKCIQKRTTGSGKNSSTHTHTLWENSSVVKKDALAEDRSQSAIPVLFDIPFDTRPTQVVSPREVIYWELSVNAATPGVDFAATFIVPVFKTAKSDPAKTAQTIRRQEANTSKSDPASLPEEPIPHLKINSDFAEETHYTFETFRNFKQGIAPFFLGLGMSIGVYFLFKEGGSLIIFGLFLSLFAVICLLGSMGLLHSNLEIRVSKSSLRFKRRSFFFSSERQTAPSDIDKFEVKESFKVGNTSYYDIHVHLESGKKLKIPTKIKGQTDTDRLITLIEADLGFL